MRRRRFFDGVLVAALALSTAGAARARSRFYVVAIGNDEPPVAVAGQDAPGPRLLYADDDAAAIAELGLELGAEVTVLSVLDAPSQRRFPGIARRARQPTLAELRKVVAWHRERFEKDTKAGDEPVLLLFYSGHGMRGGEGGASLALLDGPLTSTVLYDEILGALPARYVHIVVDACHAEAVVRPRDLEARSVPLTAEQERDVLAKSSLARFPNAGAIVATASGAQAHEWDAFEQGVFTHELLSALRGGADVNGDGKVEYSEVAAFLSAANHDVLDPRARLSVVVRAPAVNGHAPVVDLGASGGPRLLGAGRATDAFWVENERGSRIADVRPEPGYRFRLLLPSGQLLFVRTSEREAPLQPNPGEQAILEQLKPSPRGERERGSIETSFRRGLFATPFGPTYYRGFVDGRDDMLSVSFDRPNVDAPGDPPGRAGPDVVAWASVGTGVALAGVAGTFAVLAWKAQRDFDDAPYEREQTAAHDRFIQDRAIFIGAGAAAVAALGFGVWRLSSSPAPSRLSATPWLGPRHAGLSLEVAW